MNGLSIKQAECSSKLGLATSWDSTSFSRLSKASHGIAYLFPRFPSFTQTFCYREVAAMLNQGMQFPIFSIYPQKEEPLQEFPTQLEGRTIYIPEDLKFWAKKERWKNEKRDWMKILRERMQDKKVSREIAWMVSILKKLGIHHLHVHFASKSAYFAYLIKKTSGISYSLTLHANDFWKNFDKKLVGDFVSEAEFVAMVTDFSVQWLSERFPNYAHKIHCVYNGIFPDQFKQNRNPTDPPRILSIGRYVEQKGFSDLIKACAALRNEAFECLIVGTGPLENALKEQVRKAGLEGRVFIVGPRTENEIVDLLSRTSIFAFPCKKAEDGKMDNLPTVIMEAMWASVPVISTRLGGTPEMVIHGETGYLIREGDDSALTTALRTLLQDPALAIQMGERGRMVAEEKFDITKTANALKSLFARYGILRAESCLNPGR